MAEYESMHRNASGVAVGGLTTGIIGTALGVLNGAGGLLGLPNNTMYEHPRIVTKDELKYVQELGQKDSEIALLKSEQNTEVKIAEVYDRLITRINADRREQDFWNAQQAQNNCQMSSAIAANANSISALQTCCNNITKVVVPITAVCPEPMPKFNSFTTPTTTA